MSGLSNTPRRRSSKPSIPNLHIVINDRISRSAASELDSGYQSAVSVCIRERMNDAPEQSPLVPEPVTIPDNTIFTTTDPFGTQRQSPPPDRPSPIAEEPSSLMVPSRKNHKKLSLTSLDAGPQLRTVPSNMSMQSVAPNTVPMSLPPSPHHPHRKLSMQAPRGSATHDPGQPERESLPTRRRSSVMSLPPSAIYPAAPRSKYTTGRRAIEDEGDGDAYANGPVEILPGVWLGAEDNANNWPVLAERSISAVLNVAKEVILSFEEEPNDPKLWQGDSDMSRGRLYPANERTGRPELVYLHLPWSHGQNDLVNTGFVQAMAFIDRCRASNLGVLIHCQLGISRSATLAIAYVMRSAHSPSAPSHIAKLQKEGMQGAYNFVKSKSQTIGPNMSLIYQLLEYERFLSPSSRPGSDTSVDSAEAEWTRQRMAMDLEEQEEASRTTSPDPLSDGTTAIEAAEARELDQRMIARRDQRSSSRASSLLSVSVSDGQSVGPNGNGTWKSRFGHGLAYQQASGGYRARGLSSGSDMSFASGRSSLVSGDSLVLEENEDENDDADSPRSHSRKDSGDLGNACDETFVLAPAPSRPPTTFILQPLPPSARTRGGKASPLGLPASGRSSPALSRRSNELGAMTSARPDQTTFGASQLLPPSARPDQMGFVSQIGSSSTGPTQTSFGFPLMSSRRRSADAPSLGPPPVRSARLSNSSCLGPLDTVPPSPVRASDQEQEAITNSLPRTMEKKSKPAPLRLPVQARSESLKIIATSSEASLSESQSSNGSSSSSLTSEGADSQPTNETAPQKVRRKDRISRPRVSHPPHLNVMGSATPHQTLFIFPPSPQRTESVLSSDGQASVLFPSTPCTMLLKTTAVLQPTSVTRGEGWRTWGYGSSSNRSSSRCSSTTTSVSSVDTTSSSVTSSSSRRRRVSALPSGITPTLAAFRQRHFGTPASPSTPTTATAHVAARGWVGVTAAPGHSRTFSAELLGPLSPSTARPPKLKFGL